MVHGAKGALEAEVLQEALRLGIEVARAPESVVRASGLKLIGCAVAAASSDPRRVAWGPEPAQLSRELQETLVSCARADASPEVRSLAASLLQLLGTS
jgi:hypothetical protein